MPAICRTVPFVSVMKRTVGFCNQALQTITLRTSAKCEELARACVSWAASLFAYRNVKYFWRYWLLFLFASAALFYCQIWLTLVWKLCFSVVSSLCSAVQSRRRANSPDLVLCVLWPWAFCVDGFSLQIFFDSLSILIAMGFLIVQLVSVTLKSQQSAAVWDCEIAPHDSTSSHLMSQILNLLCFAAGKLEKF